MSADTISMRDALYEAPGPKTRRRIVIGTVIASIALVALVAAVAWRFYITGQFAPQYWEFFTKWSTWNYLLSGLLGTFEVALTAGAIALVLGVVFMLGRISKNKVVSTIFRIVIDFFRGVPSLLLIYFFFLVIPAYGIKMSSFWMLALPISLTASGVLAEVFRAGVNAVPAGQREAALSIGMSEGKVMRKIILPQAVRFVIPSLISQLVVVVKDTTVAYVVSYPDMLQNARVLITNYDALVSTYFVVAIIYILINFAINQASIYVARRSGTRVISRNQEDPV
ncbi:amino acid ABC transporter permease [Olsenella intestinalis]|uniref:amino acid ABC transporter permease n=1 Tax=Olsenella intestinalis TaxID=2930083 RepID=UPI00200F1652|nr:amino acid ABC transporter permease [Olsenella intestinalis]